MKVLWFAVTSSLYSSERNAHNGGGWIESLERIITSREDIDLGVAFVSSNKDDKKRYEPKVVYYPMYIEYKGVSKIKDYFTVRYVDERTIQKCLDVIEDFKPDLIQVFGSEWCFGLIKEYTDIPVVIHMQGFWPEYRNSIYPPGFSKFVDLLLTWYNPKKFIGKLLEDKLSKERALREEYILRINNLYMGRTKWDYAITKFYNEKSKYFFCSEALRLTFIDEKRIWKYRNSKIFTFITVGSGSTLKGYDVVLKTAQLLKQYTNIKFEWLLLGPTALDMKVPERLAGVKCSETNIVLTGKCSAEVVKDYLLSSNLYIHTAYIDNSPNAICEAQYLGLPIISTNVGGISSLFSNDYPSDMLVSTNDPYYLAAKIKEIVSDSLISIKMSEENFRFARERHSDENIYNSLLSTYKSILDASAEFEKDNK